MVVHHAVHHVVGHERVVVGGYDLVQLFVVICQLLCGIGQLLGVLRLCFNAGSWLMVGSWLYWPGLL